MTRGYSSRERVLATFAHREPDRVPAWLGACPELREKARAFLGLEDAGESLSRYLGDDFRRVFGRYAGPVERDPLSGLTMADATYRTPFGVERHGYGYGQPLHHPLALAKTVSDIEAFDWPEVDWVDVSHILAEAAAWDGQYAILGGDWSPFFHDAIDLMGMEALLVGMYEAPTMVEALLTHTADYYLGVSRRMFQVAGDLIDIFFLGNDFGAQAGPIVGGGTFRRFLLPQLRRFVDLGHEFGHSVLLHCDGSLYDLIPMFLEIGLDGLQSVQPSSHKMELARLKREFGRSLVFMGCVDTQFVLISGTPASVREHVCAVLKTMMPGGGFVASPSHDFLLQETPVENVIAMYETIRDCGVYR